MFCLWEASEDKLHHLIMEKHYVPNQTLYHSVLRNNSNRTQWKKGVAAMPPSFFVAGGTFYGNPNKIYINPN